jgi:N-methylhydantoinase A
MRYAGQGYTVSVPLPEGDLDGRIAEPLRRSFGDAYEHRFGSRLASAEPEALHWRLTARLETQAPDLAFRSSQEGEAHRGERRTYFPEAGEFVTCMVYDRYTLQPGQTIAGPALVQERESTVVIGPGGSAKTDDLGNLTVTIEER